MGVTYYDFRNLQAGNMSTRPTDYWLAVSTDGGKSFGNVCGAPVTQNFEYKRAAKAEAKDWAAALVDQTRLKREGFFDPEPVAEKWSEHQNGSRNWHYLLWDVLMFQAWLEAQ